MYDNFNFNDYDEIAPLAINESHMAVLLLCDVSGSMRGKPLENLNLAVNRFAADICKDEKAARRVDVAVVGFDHEASIVMNWRPVSEMGQVNLAAGGGTNLSNALELGVNMLRERCHLYEDSGIQVKIPYLILITDGYGGDVTDMAKLIQQRTDEKKLRLWVLAAHGYDKKTVAQLTRGKRVFELVDGVGQDFTEFFDLMSNSIKIASTSAPGESIYVKSNIGKEGSTCRVPDFVYQWLNE